MPPLPICVCVCVWGGGGGGGVVMLANPIFTFETSETGGANMRWNRGISNGSDSILPSTLICNIQRC